MDKEIGQGQGFSWPGDILAQLPEEVEPGSVFPLQLPENNLVRWHPETPNEPVCGPNQSDGDPTIDVYARPGVGFPPL